jgi:beta-lactamase regulating signal transducer with metallopeptidase domain
MMLSWMLGALLAGACLVLAAHALESAADRIGWSRRPFWIAAIVLMCVAPVVSSVVRRDGLEPVVQLRPAPAIPQMPNDQHASSPRRDVASSWNATASPMVTTARVDSVLMAIWALLVAFTGAIVGRAMRQLHRSRKSWVLGGAELHATLRAASGERTPVWIAEHIGPAAFGFLRQQVVIPQWAMVLSDDERVLLLAHEGAHIRAHDPRIRALALMLVILLPWHLPLIYAYRRLCRAVEHDCDARVLAAHRDARAYGRLLVHSAEWLRVSRDSLATRWMLTPVPAFVAQASDLELRVRALVRPALTARARAAAIAATAAGLGALVVTSVVRFPHLEVQTAAATRSPFSLRGAYPSCRTDVLPIRGTESTGERFIDDCLRDAILARPTAFESLQRAETPLAWIVVDENGQTVALETGLAGTARRDSGRPLELPYISTGTGTNSFAVDRKAMRDKFPAIAAQIEDVTLRTLRIGVTKVSVVYSVLRQTLTQAEATASVPPVDRRGTREATARAAPTAGPRGYPPCQMNLFPISARAFARGERYIDSCVRDAIADRAPELTRTEGPTERTAWIVFGSAGEALGFASGSGGTKPMSAQDSTNSDSATLSSPAGEFSVTADALRAKFPALADQIRGLGVMTVSFGGRRVNVIFAHAQRR